jgi:hypothetical protein
VGGGEMNETGFKYSAEGHRYTFDGVAVPGITQVLSLSGFVDARWFNPTATERGTAVHSAALFLVEGTLDWASVDPEALPRLRQFEAFLNEHTPEMLFAEVPLYSTAWKFAGRFDFLFDFMGGPSIVELKTGKAGLAAKLQTAAQKVLIEEKWGFQNVKRFALELPAEGKYRIIPHADLSDKNMFLNALASVHRRINEGELKI